MPKDHEMQKIQAHYFPGISFHLVSVWTNNDVRVNMVTK